MGEDKTICVEKGKEEGKEKPFCLIYQTALSRQLGTLKAVLFEKLRTEMFDRNRSNTFQYRERIAAGYLSGNTQLGKFSLQVGLRLEHTDACGDLLAYKPVDNETVDTAYTSLFPSAALGFQLSKKHQLNLTYRRSIDRPRYQDLNPFEFRLLRSERR